MNIGDTPEQLGSCTASDAVMIEGSVVKKEDVEAMIAYIHRLCTFVRLSHEKWKHCKELEPTFMNLIRVVNQAPKEQLDIFNKRIDALKDQIEQLTQQSHQQAKELSLFNQALQDAVDSGKISLSVYWEILNNTSSLIKCATATRSKGVVSDVCPELTYGTDSYLRANEY